MKGAAAAQGAFVWSHGAGGIFRTDNSTFGPPLMAYLMRDAAWDVFAFKRTIMAQDATLECDELLRQVADLKSKGYRRIVLAGQSAGAWISIMAARRSADVYAVIAFAPAHFGTDQPRMNLNATGLFDYLDSVKSARIMLAFFPDDPYDPGGRGPRSEEILSRRGVPHLVLDRPAGFSGHSAGESGRFFRRFSGCWLALVSDRPVPRQAECESNWGDVPSGSVPLPKGLTIAASSSGSGAPFLGKWWGTYDIGREVVLVMTKADGDRVEVVNAVGPMPTGDDKGSFGIRSGRVSGGELVVEEAGKSTLRMHLRTDGQLEVLWTAANGRTQLTTALRRLPQ